MQSGLGFAFLTLCKGIGDRMVVPAILQWLSFAGLNGDLRVRSDGETAIVSVVQALASARSSVRTVVETTPVSSFGSIGACDYYIQLLTGQVRALRLDFRRRFQLNLPVNHPLFEWLVRHSAFLLNRFHHSQPRGQKTAFELLHSKSYISSLACFGALGMARSADALDLPKAEPRWFNACWLGRSEESDEHIVASTQGIRCTRSFRLLPPGSQRADCLQQLAKWSIHLPLDVQETPEAASSSSSTVPPATRVGTRVCKAKAF